MSLFNRWRTREIDEQQEGPRSIDIPETPSLTMLAPVAKRAETLIAHESDIPKGEYVEIKQMNLPPSMEEMFAVLSPNSKLAILLIAVDIFAQEYLHQQYELIKRLKEQGYANIEVLSATQEVVKTIHSGHYKQNKNGAVEYTDIEATIWSMVERAVEQKASDIHIETRGNYAKVYFRIYGERVQQNIIATKTAIEIANVLYSVHADSDNKDVVWDHRVVKNTVIDYTGKNNNRIQLRFSSAPIHPSGNFHVVIRLLVMDKTTIKGLNKIGYTTEQVKVIEDMLIGSQGMVLLVGPTNSGKSTSLQSFVEHIYKQRGKNIKVITVEDPVEYVIADACQIGVPHGRKNLEDERTKSIFTTFLKATLRQDPDVVIIGEIRDVDSANAVKDLVLAGRKLLTTLHAYEAFAVYPRLKELGIPPSILYMHGFISGIIYQRLVPQLCPHCAIPIERAVQEHRIADNVYQRLMRITDVTNSQIKIRGDGCEHCCNMGIVGRTICAEVLVPDNKILEYLSKGQEAQARQYWLAASKGGANGMGPTVLAHAINTMKKGVIDPTDVEIYINLMEQEYIHHEDGTRSIYL